MNPSARPASLGKIKGAAFAELLGWYRDRFGQDAIREVLDATARVEPGHLTEVSRSFGILSSQWYAAELVHAALDTMIRQRTPAEVEALAQEAAARVMGNNLRGLYRAAFSLCVSPERYARHAPMLWSLHYDTGEPRIMVTSTNVHLKTFVGWSSHHSFSCQLNMAAAKPIYDAMGCKNVSYQRLGCISLGAQKCQFTVTWA